MSPLDNPIWHSLSSRHAYLAIANGGARKYPADVAPFMAIDSIEMGRDIEALAQSGDRIGILGVIPEFGPGWELYKEIEIYQYIWEKEVPNLQQDSRIVHLGEDHIPAMLELTALVYPSYFRAGTARLGDYFGVIENGQLCAMAGIRMNFDGHQEISAVCTHPDSRGIGLASLLSLHLIHLITKSGEVAFLHTESDNSAAQSVYERLGFTLRRKLPFSVVDRL